MQVLGSIMPKTAVPHVMNNAYWH